MKAGWQIKKLGDICAIELGKTPFRANKLFWDVEKKTQNVWLSIADLLNGDGKFVSDSKEYISDKGANISKKVKSGTLLVSFKLTLGRLAFAGRDLFTNEAIASLSIRHENEIFKDYLFHFLDHFDWNLATEGDVKIKGRTLNKQKLKEILIFYPPMPEQQRIVSILDEAFEGIATATANAKKNLQYSREIYESVSEGFFASSTDSSETIELGEIIVTLTDYHANGSYEILKQNVELKDTEDYAWMVRSTDFENGFEKDMRYISKSAYEYLKKSQVFGGEIIMSKIGNAGKVYLMPEINRPCSLAMNLFLIRLNNYKASNKYIYRFLKSKRGEIQIKSRLKGTATQTITKDNVRTLRIPLLPRVNQDLLESKLESLEAETEKLEAIYQQKLTVLEELKKSILNQAFSGQLN